MRDDPFAGLFKHGYKIDLPGGEHENNARALATMKLVSADEKAYIRCWNPLDRDHHDANEGCPGRVYLKGAADEYECPGCGRELHAFLKNRFFTLRLKPDLVAMRRFILDRLKTTFVRVEERPAGVFRIPAASGDVIVLLLDVHAEQSALSNLCRYSQGVILVAGQRPCGITDAVLAPMFRLAEIALGVVDRAFLRTVRRLAGRVIAAPAPFGPILANPDYRMALTIASNANYSRLRAPRGCRWSEVTMYLIDGETIAVRIGSGRLHRFHHYDVGLADRRSGSPNKQWRLLESLCENFGVIQWRGHAGTFGAFKQQVSELRRALQTIFGIHADPFKRCKQRDGLVAAFQARPELPNSSQYDESLTLVGES